MEGRGGTCSGNPSTSVETNCTYTGLTEQLACNAVVLVASRSSNDELYLDEPDRGDALLFRREVTALATAGRLLANADIAGFMVKCFGQTKGQFADHLLSSLEAAKAAGGEAGPMHSAGLKVAHQLSWPYIELRADWSETPIADLRAAWDVYKPQAGAYVQRAIDPTQAPSYGVPGDL